MLIPSMPQSLPSLSSPACVLMTTLQHPLATYPQTLTE
jgi:hypothetical protein